MARPFALPLTCLAVICCIAPLEALQAQDEGADPVATRKYAVALGFQKKKVYDQAAKRWQQWIAAYPKDKRVATAHHHLGVCQIQTGTFPAAVKTFQTLLAKYGDFPNRDSAQFNLGLSLYNLALASNKPADFNPAAAAFAEVTAKYGNSAQVPAALYYQAECLGLAENFNGALPIYQRLVGGYADSPVQPRAHYAYGATLQDLEKDAEAEAIFKAFIQKFGQDPLVTEVRLRLGLTLFNQQKYPEAAPLFAQTAAVADFASADFALMNYAQALFTQDKLKEAAAQYESLPKKFAESQYIGAALLAAGKCRYRTEELPIAQTNLTAAVNLKNDASAEASYWLGRTLVRLKKPAEAVPVLDAAIAAYPKSEFLPLCQYGRIDAIDAIPERRKEAVPLFAQFAAQHAKHEKAPEALYRAGLTALQLADHATAQKHSDAYLANGEFVKHELTPDVLLLAAESSLQAEMPNAAKAEAFYRRLVAQYAQHESVPRAQLGIGACLHATEKHDAAIKHLTQSAGVFKDPVLLAESRLLIGRCQLDAMRAKDAIPVLQSAIAAKPDWEHVDEVLFVLAVSMRAADQLDPAIAELNKLNKTHAQSTYRDQAFYQLGEIYFLQEKHDNAIAAYQTVVSQLAMSKLVPAALYGIAAAQFEKADFNGAVGTLNTLVANHAASPMALRGKQLRGMSRLRLGQHKEGLPDLTEYLASNPPKEDAYRARFALARCQVGLKQFDAAIAELTKLLGEQPDNTAADDVYYELGFAYSAVNKPKEAADAFRTLAQKLPMSERAAESWYRVGDFHVTQEQLPEAAAAYSAGLKSPPVEAVREKLYYKLGSVQHSQKQYAAAIQTLDTQLKEFAQGELAPAATYLVGESFYRENKFQDALTRFAAVVALPGEPAKEFRARALYRSGICAANLKQWPVSQQHYQTLIGEFAQFEQIGEAKYGLGVALQSQNKLNEARGIFKQVTDTLPDTETAAKSWFMMGQCWFAEKKYAEAIDCFSEVAFGFKHDEWQPLSYFEAGRCYVQLKDKEAAKSMLKTVVDEFPQHARAKDAQTILAELSKP